MEELDIALITRRSIHGVFALVSRTFVITLISSAVSLILPALLGASSYGVYFLVTAIIAFLQYFSDIGLAAALIQKKEKLTDDDLKTTFTIQQGMVLSVVIIVFLLSPWLSHVYKLDVKATHLMQALVFAFFLSSLKTIPSILLERELRFDKLVVPQVVESLVFNLVVLVCAIKGYGVDSYTYAVLSRGICGLVAVYAVSPWRMQIGFSKEIAKKLLSFGIPFQMNSFLALIKDDLLVVYAGSVLTHAQLGYIGFAQKLAFMPLRLIMDNVIRITFPSFSRLQHDKESLSTAIEKSVFASVSFIFPALVGLVVTAPYFIRFVPKYHIYTPIVFSLLLFAINAALSAITTPLVNALNAIGKIKLTLGFMVFWTVLTWVLTPALMNLYGFNGFALASAIISGSIVGVIYFTKKYIAFNVFDTVFFPAFCSLIMGGSLYAFGVFYVHNIVMTLVMIGVGVGVYAASMYVLAREQLHTDIALVMRYLRK